jgi:NAD(P)-dependent dehydrogenase (short-subunit alcohol dehydrogenase family)
MQTQTVVITGASAGIGRAAAPVRGAGRPRRHARRSFAVVTGAVVAGAFLARQLGRRR